MKLEEAGLIAADLFYGQLGLAKHFTNWKICGSIRRLCENVKDIDIVAIENKNGGFGEPVLSKTIKLLDFDGEVESLTLGNARWLNGKSIKRFKFRGIMIDLYLATEKTYETLILIRTGSAEHNKRLAGLAMSKNMKLKAGGEGLVARNNEAFIYADTEESILMELLGRVPEPKDRN